MKYHILFKLWILEYQMFVLLINFQFVYILDTHYLVFVSGKARYCSYCGRLECVIIQ